MHEYLKDGAEIYRRSFATIRAESDLGEFDRDAERVAVRMIHASGQTDLARDITLSRHAVARGRAALREGRPIVADTSMVCRGITAARLPADNEVLVRLQDSRVTELAKKRGTTRTAAGIELNGPHFGGAVIAIGNAPTALFHLLDMLELGADKPALIIGIPVGFIGAVESKEALIDIAPRLGIEYITVRGRRGGSAITAAAVNAVARENEL